MFVTAPTMPERVWTWGIAAARMKPGVWSQLGWELDEPHPTCFGRARAEEKNSWIDLPMLQNATTSPDHAYRPFFDSSGGPFSRSSTMFT
jgi:hypothetical protein